MSRKPTVILHTNSPAPALEALRADHGDLDIHTCDNYSGLPGLVARTGAEVVYSVRFAGTPQFPRPALVESPTVRWVSVGGSGTDHLQPWDPGEVTVTNAAGVAANMMAEYVLGAMLSFSLDLRGFQRRQRERQWAPQPMRPVEGRTVLILGLGKTGQAVAQRAKAMGMTVIGVRAQPAAIASVDEVHGAQELPALWPRADFIVVCVPLLPDTRGLVGPDALAAIKSGTFLIDVSRGGVVDQAALMAALDAGHLAGAALDVFETEPLPPENPLWAYENVTITPHCSSIYDGWDLKAVRMFSDNLARYRRGEPLQNVVVPQRGY
jgi:phosphoglycerate dehydrogenase-like enzyme